MDAQSATAEKRLWTSTVNRAVQDIEDLYIAIELAISIGQSPRYLEDKLRTLKYEVGHDWFSQICLAADLHVDKIVLWMERRERVVYSRLH